MDIKIYTPVGFWPPAAPTQPGLAAPAPRFAQAPAFLPPAAPPAQMPGFPPPVARLPEIGFPPPVARVPEIGFPPPVARLPEVAGFPPAVARLPHAEEPMFSLLGATPRPHRSSRPQLLVDEEAEPIEQARQIHRQLTHHVTQVSGRTGALDVHQTHELLTLLLSATQRMDAIAATVRDDGQARELGMLRRDVESARQSFEQIHLGAAQAANFQATYPAQVQSWVALEVARTAALGVAQRQAVIEASRAMSTSGMVFPPGMPMGMPGMGMPGMGMPGMGMPGMGMPGVGMPGMGMPGVGMYGAGMPGVAPGLAVPGVGMPAAAAMAVAPGMAGAWMPAVGAPGVFVR